jgi:hypothetical protein
MGSKERRLSYSFAFKVEVMNYAEKYETGQLKGVLAHLRHRR